MIQSARPITIVPLGAVPETLVRVLAHDLTRVFGVDVTCAPRIDPGDAHELDAERFDANALLDLLIETRASSDVITLGILDGNVAAEGLAFAFGEATVGGCCALVALARLRLSHSSSNGARDLLRRRVLTEAVHEVGHVLGLGHCELRSCAMFLSRDVQDTDAKGPVLCAACSGAIA